MKLKSQESDFEKYQDLEEWNYRICAMDECQIIE